MPKHLFHTILLAALIISMSFFVSCENDNAEISRVTATVNDPVEEIKMLETLYSDSGIVKVKVTAASMSKKRRPKPITEMPRGMLIEFYNPNRQVTSKLSAKYAIHYEFEHRWEAKNDVEVVNEKGETLNTEKLIWDERKELLSSDQFVKITTPEEIIMGKGFEANQDFSRYKIFNVTGRITIKQ